MKNSKIISVSRRTDIPAFYTDWFMNGIKRGYVDSINPFNRKYVSRVSLKPEDVICFVFWSKNPKPLIKHLGELDELGYKYYFQFTLNPYSQDIEKSVPNKNDVIIKTFIDLSNKIGKEKVVWRYDPILINQVYTKEYHVKYFDALCSKLHNYTNKVVISFIDLYKKTKSNTKGLFIEEMNNEMMIYFADKLSKIAHSYGLEISTCSELIDIDEFGIKHNKCIDDDLINEITNQSIVFKKDKGQRKECGCVESIDIGSNNTCKHFCAYCYANTSKKAVVNNVHTHNINSSILCGKLIGDEEIHWRNGENSVSLKDEIKKSIKTDPKQLSFFD